MHAYRSHRDLYSLASWPHLPAGQAFRRFSCPRVTISSAPNALVCPPEGDVRAMRIYSGGDVVSPILPRRGVRRSPLADVVVRPLGWNESAVPDPVRPLVN